MVEKKNMGVEWMTYFAPSMKGMIRAWWLISLLYAVLTYLDWLGTLPFQVLEMSWKPFVLGITVLSATIFLRRFSASKNLVKYVAQGEFKYIPVEATAVNSILIKRWIALAFVLILVLFYLILGLNGKAIPLIYAVYAILLVAHVYYVRHKQSLCMVLSEEHIVLGLDEVQLIPWAEVAELSLKYDELQIETRNKHIKTTPLRYFDEQSKKSLISTLVDGAEKNSVFVAQQVKDLLL